MAIDWSNIIDSRYPPELRANYLHMDTPMLPDEYVKDLNAMISEQSSSSSVVYLYLPLPPSSQSLADDYLEQLTQLTDNLPPTVLVHGLNPVTSTTL